MPRIQHGSTPIIRIQHGSTPLTRIQHGSTVVWTAAPPIGDDFERDDGALGANWTDLGPSGDWKLGIEDGRARVLIPDGVLGGFWTGRESIARYNAATAPANDCYVEARMATRGDAASLTVASGYYSSLLGRGSNTGGTGGDGVGFTAMGGQCRIVTRLSGTMQSRAEGGSFQPGDIIKVTSVGFLHTIFVNGTDTNVWNDAGHVVPTDASHRSLIMRGIGAKDLLGPRRFSPAFDYVRMG